MESYIFSRLYKWIPEKINVPLRPNEELSIQLIKTPNTEYAKIILYSEDGENEITKTHPCYIDIDYLFFLFCIETSDIEQIHLILEYDREQESFIHVHDYY
jgi:hypothetical protein